jgi:hypothetical protein
MYTVTCLQLHVYSYMYTVTCIQLHVYGYMYTVTCLQLHVYSYMYRATCIQLHVYSYTNRNFRNINALILSVQPSAVLLLNPGYNGSSIFRNVGKNLPVDAA